MIESKNILVVEDDEDILELMSFHLSKDKHKVDTAKDGKEAYHKLLKTPYDLIIMDWMIPEINGLDLVGWMKKPQHIQNRTPVLMVTAKSEPSDVIAGLESGADDYMIKPFNFDVLRARIQNLLKRKEFLQALDENKQPAEILSMGDLMIKKSSHEVFLNNEKLDLTYSEFSILEVLISYQGRALSRKQLISFIQGEEMISTGRTIDTHISSLRKKLKHYGDTIQTVRGIGYRMSYDKV